MRRHAITSASQRCSNMPLTAPAALALIYVTMLWVFTIYVLITVRIPIDDRAISPALAPVFHTVAIVNGGWMLLLAASAYGVVTEEGLRSPRLAGIGIALALISPLAWAALGIGDALAPPS